MVLVGFSEPRDRRDDRTPGRSLPSEHGPADRPRRTGPICPRMPRPAGPVLVHRPGRGRLFLARPVGDSRLDPSALGCSGPGPGSRRPVALAPSCSPAHGRGPDGRSCLLLDGHANAGAYRPGDRPHRGLGHDSGLGREVGAPALNGVRRAPLSRSSANGDGGRLARRRWLGLPDEDNPARHGKADAGRDDDADHGRGQLVVGEEYQTHRQP